MTPGKVRAATLVTKAAQVESMLQAVRALPLSSLDEFESDPRNPAAGESYLRRALEALFDLSRHILAKAFAEAPSEYKSVAAALGRVAVLDDSQVALMLDIAGYRNRMVHFYDEISSQELYEILTGQMEDVAVLLEALLGWAQMNPQRVDGAL